MGVFRDDEADQGVPRHGAAETGVAEDPGDGAHLVEGRQDQDVSRLFHLGRCGEGAEIGWIGLSFTIYGDYLRHL